MKINHLTVTNVLGIKRVDIDLNSPVAIFAGRNGAGKSSLQNAIRMAMAGQTSRIALKKDFGMLVHEGQKKGEVVVSTPDGPCQYSLPAGKHSGCIDNDAIQQVLDPTLFAKMDDMARRKFLFDLAGLKIGTEEVRKRLQQRSCDHKKAEAVIPLLRTGFPGAHEEAKRRVSEARGEWKGITGEVYGSQKADGWVCEAVVLSAEEATERETELQEMEAALVTVQQQLEAQNTLIGELNAKESAWKLDQAEINGLKQRAAMLGRHTDARDSANLQLLEQNEKVARLRAAAGEGPQDDPVPCVHCGGALRIVDGAVVAHVTAPFDAEAAARLPLQEESLQMLERALANRQRDFDDAYAADIALKERTPVPEVTQGEMEAAKGRLDALKGSKVELEKGIQEIKAEMQAQLQAEAKTRAAAAAHTNVVEWTLIADAFAPDGIPSEMLSDALTPFNKRLVQSAERSGWPMVRVGADMTIFYQGRPYILLSESEQWRADAMLAEAIAQMSGLRLLMLDRMDVIDVEGRGQFIDWMYALIDAGEIDTALIFATMKSAPDLQDIDTFWIENGSIKPKAAEKAA